MEKLELKHLAPYLPYGLRSADLYIKDFGLTSPLIAEIVPSNILKFTDGSSRALPIFYPLCDLDKEIKHNDKKFIPLVELLKIKHKNWYEKYNGTRYGEIGVDEKKAWFEFQATLSVRVNFYGNSIFDYPEYWIMEKLFEWHFDVFGLITKGLAVDINTLNK